MCGEVLWSPLILGEAGVLAVDLIEREEAGCCLGSLSEDPGLGCFACGMRAPLVNLLSLMSGPRSAVVGCIATDLAAQQRWPCIKDDT